jgi:DMSO/TMAO reductase YedYZ heme-binding membrane subunit
VLPHLADVSIAEQLMQISYHMVYFGFPLLVIIMYTGALNNRRNYTKKLLSIRKELPIMAGFRRGY